MFLVYEAHFIYVTDVYDVYEVYQIHEVYEVYEVYEVSLTFDLIGQLGLGTAGESGDLHEVFGEVVPASVQSDVVLVGRDSEQLRVAHFANAHGIDCHP